MLTKEQDENTYGLNTCFKEILRIHFMTEVTGILRPGLKSLVRAVKDRGYGKTWDQQREAGDDGPSADRVPEGERMKKRIWDLYAPIYKRAMKADQQIYDFMYDRIPEMVRDREVLEIATGPGLLAKHVAPAAGRVVATDYSDGMIAEAKKGGYPANLRFEVADAMNLPYNDDSFDVVLIANALHIVPDPEQVLREIFNI